MFCNWTTTSQSSFDTIVHRSNTRTPYLCITVYSFPDYDGMYEWITPLSRTHCWCSTLTLPYMVVRNVKAHFCWLSHLGFSELWCFEADTVLCQYLGISWQRVKGRGLEYFLLDKSSTNPALSNTPFQYVTGHIIPELRISTIIPLSTYLLHTFDFTGWDERTAIRYLVQ